MTYISASAAASTCFEVASDIAGRSAAIGRAAQLLLPHLESGRRIDAPLLRVAMDAAFGGTDASGAWAWKTGYDAHLPKRTQAGLTEVYLLRSADNPNEVVLMFEAHDLSRAKAFAASAELRDKMTELTQAMAARYRTAQHGYRDDKDIRRPRATKHS